MTAQLLTAILLMLPVVGMGIFARNAMPENIPSTAMMVIILAITFVIVYKLFIDKIRKATGSSEKNPDGIAWVAFLTIGIMSVFCLVYHACPLFYLLSVVALVFYGLFDGAGERPTPEDIDLRSASQLRPMEGLSNPIADDSFEIEITWTHYLDPFVNFGVTVGHTIKIFVPKALYHYSVELSKAQKHGNNYSEYATESKNRVVILSIAQQIRNLSIEYGISDFAELHLLFSCFTVFSFIDDKTVNLPDTYHKYPAQTLTDRGGDCIDIAIVCSSVLAELGYDVFVSVVKDHVFIGTAGFSGDENFPVVNARHMFVCEVLPGVETDQGDRKIDFWYGYDPESTSIPTVFVKINNPDQNEVTVEEIERESLLKE